MSVLAALLAWYLAAHVDTLFENISRGAGVLYGACRGVWVMILFKPPSTEDMILARSALKTMSERCPDGFPTLTWVLPSAGFSMESEARRTAAEVTLEYAGKIKAQATLIEGSGFQAATVRAIVSGIDMLARSKAPKQTFSELRPCVEWCAPRRAVQGGPSVQAMLTALESVRGSFDG